MPKEEEPPSKEVRQNKNGFVLCHFSERCAYANFFCIINKLNKHLSHFSLKHLVALQKAYELPQVLSWSNKSAKALFSDLYDENNLFLC